MYLIYLKTLLFKQMLQRIRRVPCVIHGISCRFQTKGQVINIFPSGFITRFISVSISSMLNTCSKTSLLNTLSKVLSGKGKCFRS